MGKVKVLQIVSSLWSGGVAVLLKNYYEHMDHSEVSFDFLVTTPEKGMTEGYFEKEGCTIYHLKGLRHFFHTFFQTIKIVRKGKYKIVHVHHNDVSFFQLFAAWLGGAKIRVAHSHDELHLSGFNKYKRKFFCFLTTLFSNYHFACSENAGKFMFGKKIQKSNYLCLHNAIDYERFLYSEDARSRIRKEYACENSFILGNVGRLSAQKNQALIVDAFQSVHAKIADSKLFLIGKGTDRAKLDEQIASYHLENDVIFIEVTPNVQDFLSAFDVFVFPSVHEGLGIAFLEAQASGLKCVISDRIPKEAIVDTENVVVKSFDAPAEEWAEAILTPRKRERKAMIHEGLIQNYNIETEALKLTEWYKSHS